MIHFQLLMDSRLTPSSRSEGPFLPWRRNGWMAQWSLSAALHCLPCRTVDWKNSQWLEIVYRGILEREWGFKHWLWIIGLNSAIMMQVEQSIWGCIWFKSFVANASTCRYNDIKWPFFMSLVGLNKNRFGEKYNSTHVRPTPAVEEQGHKASWTYRGQSRRQMLAGTGFDRQLVQVRQSCWWLRYQCWHP